MEWDARGRLGLEEILRDFMTVEQARMRCSWLPLRHAAALDVAVCQTLVTLSDPGLSRPQ
jgi:hypothetical protein